MSAAVTSAAATPAEIDDLRKAWKDANMAPLWENKFAHRPPAPPESSYLWSWEKIRPLIAGAIKVASPEAIERRVLQLIPPQRRRIRMAADHQDASAPISRSCCRARRRGRIATP